MKNILKILGKAVAAIVIALIVLRLTPWWDDLLSPGGRETITFETLVLTPKPNQYLVCSPGLCAKAESHQTAPEFDRGAADVRAAVDAIIRETDAVTMVAESGDTINLMVRTPVVRWPDWVTIRFIPLTDGRSTIAIYSRSVYGRKDFGANETRITDWLAQLSTGS